MSVSGEHCQIDGPFALKKVAIFSTKKELLDFLEKNPNLSFELYIKTGLHYCSLAPGEKPKFLVEGFDFPVKAEWVEQSKEINVDLKPPDSVPLSLIPWPAVELAARGFAAGVKRYPPGNYLNPKPGETIRQHVGRYISAGLRHAFKAAAWYVFGDKRHEVDPDTGLDHMAHALNNFMMAVHIKEYREHNESIKK